ARGGLGGVAPQLPAGRGRRGVGPRREADDAARGQAETALPEKVAAGKTVHATSFAVRWTGHGRTSRKRAAADWKEARPVLSTNGGGGPVFPKPRGPALPPLGSRPGAHPYR